MEQLRYLSTDRAYAKKLIKSNLGLINFSKFSYWVGWIKVHTAKTIQDSVKIHNPELYKKHFEEDIWLSDNEMIIKLEDEYNGILYAWGLIYSINERWKKAGFDLKNHPWAVITLYNMWNPKKKIPHANPEMWGSILMIDDQKRYFGEIGELFYYYLKYYVSSS